jgi:TRAP-type C4-dicarboxylate transport system permease large subunit
MIRRGYDRAFATGIVAAVGGHGFADPALHHHDHLWLGEAVSIAALFVAAFIPRCLMAGFIMAGIYITAIRKKLPTNRARPS